MEVQEYVNTAKEKLGQNVGGFLSEQTLTDYFTRHQMADGEDADKFWNTHTSELLALKASATGFNNHEIAEYAKSFGIGDKKIQNLLKQAKEGKINLQEALEGIVNPKKPETPEIKPETKPETKPTEPQKDEKYDALMKKLEEMQARLDNQDLTKTFGAIRDKVFGMRAELKIQDADAKLWERAVKSIAAEKDMTEAQFLEKAKAEYESLFADARPTGAKAYGEGKPSAENHKNDALDNFLKKEKEAMDRFEARRKSFEAGLKVPR